jgi:hypothetical protein
VNAPTEKVSDERLEHLRRYFADERCPDPRYGQDEILALILEVRAARLAPTTTGEQR